MTTAKINQYKSAQEKLKYYIKNKDCHEYIGATNNSGYCVLMVDKKFWYAHRLAYTIYVGDIPVGMTVDHICFNKKCINAKHLQILSNEDNAKKHRKSQELEHCLVCGNKKVRLKSGRLSCKACALRRAREHKLRMRG